MDSIKNVKLKELAKLTTEEIREMITTLQFIKPMDTRQDIFNMKLRDVQDLKDNMMEGMLENLIACVKITEGTDPMEMRVIPFFALVNSIKSQLEQIMKAEVTALESSVPNFKWEAVNGADRMKTFGIYNTLEMLSGGDVTKWEAILDIPYADIFTKMYMNRVKAELDHEMMNIKTHK